MNHTLADRLQIWGLHREFALFSDSSLGFAIEATPIDISCWDTAGLNAFAQRVTQFLNGLPVGLEIQFVQDICAGNESTLKQHESIAANSNNQAAQFLTNGRLDRFRQLDRGSFEMLACP